MQARQDRQRSICVTTSSSAGAAVLQHVLDQIDAPARAVEFVAERHIGGTGGGAEAAMHAFAQDRLGFGDMGSASWSGVKLVCIRVSSVAEYPPLSFGHLPQGGRSWRARLSRDLESRVESE